MNVVKRIVHHLSTSFGATLLNFFIALPIVLVKSIIFVPTLYVLNRLSFHHSPSPDVWFAYFLTAFWFQRVSDKTRENVKKSNAELGKEVRQTLREAFFPPSQDAVSKTRSVRSSERE